MLKGAGTALESVRALVGEGDGEDVGAVRADWKKKESYVSRLSMVDWMESQWDDGIAYIAT